MSLSSPVAACCAGLVGDDSVGLALADCFESRGVDCGGIVKVKGGKTCTKTRVFAGDVHTVKQQVFRLDCLPSPRMTDAVEARVLSAIDAVDRRADAWLVSDYHGDFFTDKVVSKLNAIAASGKVMVVDSHRRLGAFRGVTCATPNEQEASLASGVAIRDDESAAEAARAIRLGTGDRCMFVTRGNRGMTVIRRDGAVRHLPIVGSSEIVDVAGAGDTVAAVVALAFALGEDAVTAGILASYAASVVVMKTGVATASPDEIRSAIEKYPLPAV